MVLGDELAVFVVVEAGKGMRIGKGRLKVISDDFALYAYPYLLRIQRKRPAPMESAV